MHRNTFIYAFPAIVLCALSPVKAEHRVALIIANYNYQEKQLAGTAPDLESVTAALKNYGIRCKTLQNLSGKKLKSELESFAENTPTRGLALVWFAGQVLPGTHKGEKGPFLAGTDCKKGDPRRIGSTGFGLQSLLQTLSAQGGSSRNAVIMDPIGQELPSKIPLPKESLMAFGKSKQLSDALLKAKDAIPALRSASMASDSSLASPTLVGKGSTVISPPDQLVEGKKAGEEWVNSRGMVFCWCPKGTFTAGSPGDEGGRYPDEKQHLVRIDRGFWISKYEMTLREYTRNRPRRTIATNKNHPLTMVHHDDAKAMTLRALTNEERKRKCLPVDWEYALPTEEQWEYAARAGSSSTYSFGDDLTLLPRHANFGDKSFYDSKDIFSNSAHRSLDDGTVRLAIVGSYRPNPWGLHDVHGNVAEWCINRAIRGGSWVSRPEYCRSAHRDFFGSRNEQNFIGFRLVIQRPSPSTSSPKKK